MEASKLSCIGSPHHALCPPTCGISRGGFRGIKAAQALQSSLSCGQLPVVGALSNLGLGLSVWAAEEASSLTDVESAGGAVGSAGLSASQSPVEGTGASAYSTVESLGDTVQSSVERVGDAASQKVAAAAGNDDMVINILGTMAFIALSLLTIAVLYLFITDFLEKRKRDEEMKKLNEEEAAARKKGGSFTAAGKGGAKGFGRKRPVEDDDE